MDDLSCYEVDASNGRHTDVSKVKRYLQQCIVLSVGGVTSVFIMCSFSVYVGSVLFTFGKQLNTKWYFRAI